MENKIITLTSTEILVIESENKAKNLVIETAQQRANQAVKEFNDVIIKILTEGRGEPTPSATTQIKIAFDPKTNRPTTIELITP